MRVLIDIVHPAHVHFYRHVRTELLDAGHEVRIASREKDLTVELLDEFDMSHECIGRAAKGSLARRGLELARRVLRLRRMIHEFGADVVLTRNPAGVQAARLAGVAGVFDTDDGSAVGIHFWAARPFARYFTTPSCLSEHLGKGHHRYRGYKALAYLHPDRFQPEVNMREILGLGPETPLFLLRFSAHDASHDRRIGGLSEVAKDRLLGFLGAHGHVVVSDELAKGPSMLGTEASFKAGLLHHLLATADLCIGDSQSVAAEAAVLGTMAIRLSSFTGRVDYLRDLEERYGLIRNFRPGEEENFFACVREACENLEAVRRRAGIARQRLLAENVDVTSWYVAFLERLARGETQPQTDTARSTRS